MRLSARTVVAWMLAGGVAGALSISALAIYVVVVEACLLGRLGRVRCHTFDYAFAAVLAYLPTFGAIAVLVGIVGGFALAVLIPRLRNL